MKKKKNICDYYDKLTSCSNPGDYNDLVDSVQRHIKSSFAYCFKVD